MLVLLAAGSVVIDPFASTHRSISRVACNPVSARGGCRPPLMGLRLGKSKAFGDIEQEMLGRLGLGEEGSDDATAPESIPTPPREPEAEPWGLDGSRPAAASTPRSGTQAWGRWSHEGESIEIELKLPEGARARDVTCEVKKDGAMRVRLAQDDEALLSGR